MRRVESVAEYRKFREEFSDQKLGFVPTMGALHIGHASLIERSVTECDITVLSIYLNPTQFNNPGDLDKYPVTLENDLLMAENLGVDVVLLPDYHQVYPDNFRYLVEETSFSRQLCGAHREGHFTGVLTVVMKLLNIVRPQCAYFGKKDYQQYQLIRDMVEAFFMDVNIIGCDTIREEDGLALSSRNLNLDDHSRELAPELHKAIERNIADAQVVSQLDVLGFDVDYIKTIDGRRYAAASLGKVRLIDNISVDEVTS
ncbi:MAG: pantoate--beta-alanine ligase [bacterium]|nr:pantoate--beta-alanine ligase [Gammaproteobacteria bacterium]HIL96974.1 pantoate--beta-alanine ligase [Pseudomonadales bacterium]